MQVTLTILSLFLTMALPRPRPPLPPPPPCPWSQCCPDVSLFTFWQIIVHEKKMHLSFESLRTFALCTSYRLHVQSVPKSALKAMPLDSLLPLPSSRTKHIIISTKAKQPSENFRLHAFWSHTTADSVGSRISSSIQNQANPDLMKAKLTISHSWVSSSFKLPNAIPHSMKSCAQCHKHSLHLQYKTGSWGLGESIKLNLSQKCSQGLVGKILWCATVWIF